MTFETFQNELRLSEDFSPPATFLKQSTRLEKKLNGLGFLVGEPGIVLYSELPRIAASSSSL